MNTTSECAQWCTLVPATAGLLNAQITRPMISSHPSMRKTIMTPFLEGLPGLREIRKDAAYSWEPWQLLYLIPGGSGMRVESLADIAHGLLPAGTRRSPEDIPARAGDDSVEMRQVNCLSARAGDLMLRHVTPTGTGQRRPDHAGCRLA